MKFGFLITARLGSSRLRRKHLLPVLGRPVLAFLIERIRYEFSRELANGDSTIVIATSDELENREFETLKTEGVEVFYGSQDNIPLRHLRAAEKYCLDAVISVDGDDILCSPNGMRCVFNALMRGEGYVKTEALPLGMNVCGYKRSMLQHALAGREGKQWETGWQRIFDSAVAKVEYLEEIPSDNTLRFTLDYEQDYEFFSSVISALGGKVSRATDLEIVNLVRAKGLEKINSSLVETYWRNYNEQATHERSKDLNQK